MIATAELKLNLGACDRPLPGFLSVDICPPADVVLDLSKRRIKIEPDGSFEITYDPWPWGDSTVKELVAFDVLEHFRGEDARVHAFNEMWRVLEHGGTATIEVPSASHGAGFAQDPTHRQPFTLNSFQYFRHESFAVSRLAHAYGIKARFKVLSLTERQYQDDPEAVWKISAVLQAVK